MKKYKNLVIGGIENKLFNLILITSIVLSLAFIGMTLYQSNVLKDLTATTSEQQKESITGITTHVMDEVVRDSMDRTTALEAYIADELFHGLGTRVEMLQEYAYKLLNDPDSVPSFPYSGPDPDRNGQITAQLFLADDTAMTPELSRKIGVIANTSDMMVSLFGASDVTNSCFIGLPEGVFLVTDDRSGMKFNEDGSVKSYDPRTRPWYTLAVEKEGLAFTDVETDAFTGDIGIVCSMPVYVDGELAAVVGSDLFLSSMDEAIQNSDENGGFLCVVNRNGHIVFSPKKEGLFAVRSSAEAADLRNSDNPQLASLIADGLNQRTDVREIEIDGTLYYMNASPMETVGWTLLSVFDRSFADQPVDMLQESYEQIQNEAVVAYRDKSAKSNIIVIAVLAAILIGAAANALRLGKKIVKPLNTITQRISNISDQDMEFKMDDEYRTGDEIEVLAESFANISHRTVEYVDQLTTVTAEKERMRTELDMARQIQASMMPSIFPAFPERKEFDIYATVEPAKGVGGDFYDFFLIDEDHLCMVMADVSGKGIPAALFMMVCKIILQSCAMLGKSAAEILTKTNEAICSNNRQGMFVTVWLGILEISTGKLICSNAGHEYPTFRLDEKGFKLVKDKHGFVIGGMNGSKYTEYQIDLKPGDKLFVYTDGLAEAMNSEEKMFGTDRIVDTLNRDPEADPETILHEMRNAVKDFVEEAEQFDDLTMLCMEYKGIE
ncbi:MAG: SpoIIE family protein phosphatase [Erysipelotrichaceae bacterium]|nr:SpoIIE family protein phosphatase [Erysipelotrichaceae bacterium]